MLSPHPSLKIRSPPRLDTLVTMGIRDVAVKAFRVSLPCGCTLQTLSSLHLDVLLFLGCMFDSFLHGCGFTLVTSSLMYMNCRSQDLALVIIKIDYHNHQFH